MTINIEKKTLGIAVLSLTAALLIAANLVSTPKALATDSIRGDQYYAVTGRIAQGGDGLYLTNRDGVMVVFVYDPNKREVAPRAIKSVVDAFNAPAPVVGPKRKGAY